METRVEHVQRIESEIADKEEQVARLQAELRALRYLLTELRSDGPGTRPLTERSLSDAVLEVLRQDGGVLSPRQIHEQLRAAGREDEPRSVGGILQAHKRKGRVESLGRGQWIIAAGA